MPQLGRWRTIRDMPARKAYSLVYTTSLKRQLKLVEPKYHSLIRETLEKQLQYEPEVKTRNRKPLKRPLAFNAEWELRFGPHNRFRVFYKVQGEEVVLLAFGEKEGDRLVIEGEEVEP
jgi:mRNA-degrading endonuclease RelE of RelBE toxin-antitoxin system